MEILTVNAGALRHVAESGADPSPPATVGPGGPQLPSLNMQMSLNLGLEQLVAVLSEQLAKDIRKDAREQQRAARDEQDAAVQRQVSELHEKATAVRNEGAVSAAFSIGGGVAQIGGAAGGSGKLASCFEKGGKVLSETSAPMGKWTYGGRQIDRDADATRASADAKRAETMADEHGALVKAADATVDKAHQALQALLQGRAQLIASLAIYRPM